MKKHSHFQPKDGKNHDEIMTDCSPHSTFSSLHAPLLTQLASRTRPRHPLTSDSDFRLPRYFPSLPVGKNLHPLPCRQLPSFPATTNSPYSLFTIITLRLPNPDYLVRLLSQPSPLSAHIPSLPLGGQFPPFSPFRLNCSLSPLNPSSRLS